MHRLGEVEGDPFEKIGLLMLGRNDIGYYVNREPETDTPLAKVWNVLGTNSTPDGRVVIELAGMVFSGYQTDKGLYLQASQEATQTDPGIRLRLDRREDAQFEGILDGRALVCRMVCQSHLPE